MPSALVTDRPVPETATLLVTAVPAPDLIIIPVVVNPATAVKSASKP